MVLASLADRLRIERVAGVRAEAEGIAAARKLDVAFEPFHEVATAAMAPKLQDTLAASIAALGHEPMRLASGAGHDAQIMTQLCPAAMLFVRCRGGVSHNPAEFCSVADMGLAIAALIGFIERFKP